MSRLIDADALIAHQFKNDISYKAFVNLVKRQPTIEPQSEPEEFEWCHDCAEYDQTAHCCHRWTKVIRQTVAEMKETQPHWIPCSERLPIKAGHYLCSFEKPNRIDRIHVDLSYWTGGRWYGYVADAITAWMPLPTPYREE